MSIKNLSEPVRLEQLAEECAELGHAALKLARILRNESPTPVTEAEARDHLHEEIADVLVCIYECVTPADMEDINKRCVEKLARWKERLKGVTK